MTTILPFLLIFGMAIMVKAGFLHGGYGAGGIRSYGVIKGIHERPISYSHGSHGFGSHIGHGGYGDYGGGHIPIRPITYSHGAHGFGSHIGHGGYGDYGGGHIPIRPIIYSHGAHGFGSHIGYGGYGDGHVKIIKVINGGYDGGW